MNTNERQIRLLPKNWFVLLIIGGVSVGICMMLVAEFGAFLNSAGIKSGTFYAFLIEISGIILIEVWMFTLAGRKLTYGQTLLRNSIVFVLFFCFFLPFLGTAHHAATPILDRNIYSQADLNRLMQYETDIESMKLSVESVSGQPLNSAQRSKDLAKLVKEKNAFASNMKPETHKEIANKSAAIIQTILRFVLQSLNWLLAYLFGLFVKSNLKKPEPEIRYQNESDAVCQYNKNIRLQSNEQAAVGFLKQPFQKKFEQSKQGFISQHPEPEKPDVSDRAKKVWHYILSNGGMIVRCNLFSSKLLSGGTEYDKCLEELESAGFISVNKSGGRTGWIYTAYERS